MPFANPSDASDRILNPKPLTEEEFRSLLPFARSIPLSARANLETELLIRQLLALLQQEKLAGIQIDSFAKFDASTTKANKWMLRYTFAVTVLTIAIAVMTFLLYRGGH